MHLRKFVFGVLGTILLGGMAAFAQQPQTGTAPDETLRKERLEQRLERHRERMGRREGVEGRQRMERGGGLGHLTRELNLTEEQRQQSRAIVQRRLAGTKSQREELFKLREKRIAGTFTAEDETRAKALRQQIHDSMAGVREEVEGVLTAEQRTRLEQLKTERKERMERRMKERQERRDQKLIL